MTYATLQQLTDRFGERLLRELTDRAEPPAGAVDVGVVESALRDTDAMIDGYLAGRYRMPLASVPAALADLAIAIAIYKLHPFAPDQKIKDDYDAALKQLREIAKGDFRLPLEGAEEPASRGNSGVQTTDRERPFSNENLHGFV